MKHPLDISLDYLIENNIDISACNLVIFKINTQTEKVLDVYKTPMDFKEFSDYCKTNQPQNETEEFFADYYSVKSKSKLYIGWGILDNTDDVFCMTDIIFMPVMKTKRYKKIENYQSWYYTLGDDIKGIKVDILDIEIYRKYQELANYK